MIILIQIYHFQGLQGSAKKVQIPDEITPQTVTHTGHTWGNDDTRNTRYLSKEGILEKQTNERWAIDLIEEVPPIIVTTRIVACTGGDNPALGHPKVFINLDNHEPVCCIYCGLRYQLAKGH